MQRALVAGVAFIGTIVGLGVRGTGQEQERIGTFATQVDVVERSIDDLQNAMNEGRFNSRDLVQAYIDRINKYEDRVNATAAISASAMAEATQLDRERAAGRVRGPLLGIPIGI